MATSLPKSKQWKFGRLALLPYDVDVENDVTIGGDLEVTGDVTFAGAFRLKTQTVAAAGADHTDAAQLGEGFNLVTGPDDAKGVILPTAAAGKVVIIKVGDGADLKVYPATGDQINALTVTTGALTVVDDVCFMLVALNATTWYTLPLLPS